MLSGWLLVVAASGLILLAGCALFIAFSCSVGNAIGILTRRDLGLLRRYLVGGKSIDEIVAERVGPCEWHAYHVDSILASVIECAPADGFRLRWEVSHVAPRSWLPEQKFYVTPLNHAAAVLIPELVPQGLRVSGITQEGYKSGVIYDLALPIGADPHGFRDRLNRRR